MTDRIQETKAALVGRLYEDVAIFRAVNPGDRYRVAQEAVGLVFELLGIKEVLAKVMVPEEIAGEDALEDRLRYAVAHEIATQVPTEITRQPQSGEDCMRAIRRIRASALAITQEVRL